MTTESQIDQLIAANQMPAELAGVARDWLQMARAAMADAWEEPFASVSPDAEYPEVSLQWSWPGVTLLLGLHPAAAEYACATTAAEAYVVYCGSATTPDQVRTMFAHRKAA